MCEGRARLVCGILRRFVLGLRDREPTEEIGIAPFPPGRQCAVGCRENPLLRLNDRAVDVDDEIVERALPPLGFVWDGWAGCRV
jgi:hypothetical protein